MGALLVVEIEITDAETYGEYIERVPPVVYAHGGRYVSRSSAVVPLAGGWSPDRVIVIEFPDMDALVGFTAADDYRALAPLRERSTRTRAIALPSVDEQP